MGKREEGVGRVLRQRSVANVSTTSGACGRPVLRPREALRSGDGDPEVVLPRTGTGAPGRGREAPNPTPRAWGGSGGGPPFFAEGSGGVDVSATRPHSGK